MSWIAGRDAFPEHVRLVAMRPGLTGVMSIAALVIGLSTYVLGPLLDERIPSASRHIDWLSYSHAAERFLNGQSLYIPQQLAGPYLMADIAGLGFVYPPPSVLLFVPFLPLGGTAWSIASALLFSSGIAAMARRDFGRHAGLALGLALLVAGVTAPYLDAVVMGNANLALAGAFAWAWAVGRGTRPVGVIAGLGGVVKLHPLALAGWTRPDHARRTIAAAVGTSSVIGLVTLPIVGIGSWLDFARAATNARPLCGYGIDAVACALLPIAGPLTTPILVACSGLLIAVAIWARQDTVAFALIVVAILVPLPEVFVHTFLFIEVLVFAIAGSRVRHRRLTAASDQAGGAAVTGTTRGAGDR